MPKLRGLASAAMSLLVVVVATYTAYQSLNAFVAATDIPIGFTIIPMNDTHPNVNGHHAAIASLQIQRWDPKTKQTEHWDFIKFADDPLNNTTKSTAFGGWLKGGHGFVYSQVDKNGAREVEPIVISELGKDGGARNFARPTRHVKQREHSNTLAEFLTLQAIYKGVSDEIEKYLFLDTTAGSTRWRLWAVDPRGQPTPLGYEGATPSLAVGGHGCWLSPNGRFLSCQTHPEWAHGKDEYVLVDLQAHTACCKITSTEGSLAVYWAPDSSGFAYLAHTGNDFRYDFFPISNGTPREGTSSLRLTEPGLVPADGACSNLKIGCAIVISGSGADRPVWSNNRFYFSRIDPTKKRPKPTIGSIGLLSNLRMCGEKGQEQCIGSPFVQLAKDRACAAGWAEPSDDGEKVAFLSPVPGSASDADCSKTDGRAQLFVYDIKTKTEFQMTHITGDRQAYNPHWQSR